MIEKYFALEDEEYIEEVYGSYDSSIKKLGFITNKGRKFESG